MQALHCLVALRFETSLRAKVVGGKKIFLLTFLTFRASVEV